MTLTSVHKEDRRRAYLEVVWKGPHQAREEAGLKQVEEIQGVRRRQILDGDAQGGEDPGRPGELVLDYNTISLSMLVLNEYSVW